MVQREKIGNVYLEIPESITKTIQAVPKQQPLKADKPDEPEPLEEPQYIFRPNDPFRAPIDEARAIASITSSHKPWVKRAWFLIFIVGPLLYAELYALSLVLGEAVSPWKAFFVENAFIMPFWLVFFFIWRRKVRT